MDLTFGTMDCLPEAHPLSEVAGPALLIGGGLVALAAWGIQNSIRDAAGDLLEGVFDGGNK